MLDLINNNSKKKDHPVIQAIEIVDYNSCFELLTKYRDPEPEPKKENGVPEVNCVSVENCVPDEIFVPEYMQL